MSVVIAANMGTSACLDVVVPVSAQHAKNQGVVFQAAYPSIVHSPYAKRRCSIIHTPRYACTCDVSRSTDHDTVSECTEVFYSHNMRCSCIYDTAAD